LILSLHVRIFKSIIREEVLDVHTYLERKKKREIEKNYIMCIFKIINNMYFGVCLDVVSK
jgi:hypothetical protein